MSRIEEFREGTRTAAHSVLDRSLSIVLSPVRAFKLLCFSIGLVVLTFSVGIGIFVYSFLRSLPDLSRMDFDQLRARTEEKVIERLVDKRKKPKWLELHDVSRDYLYSVVLSEDSTFFEHG